MEKKINEIIYGYCERLKNNPIIEEWSDKFEMSIFKILQNSYNENDKKIIIDELISKKGLLEKSIMNKEISYTAVNNEYKYNYYLYCSFNFCYFAIMDQIDFL